MDCVLLCKMNEELTKRKADVKKHLEEQLKDIPQKWWQFQSDHYIPTGQMDDGKAHHLWQQEETIVKFDFKRALRISALFLCICFLMGLYIL